MRQTIYLTETVLGVPETPEDHMSRPYRALQIVNEAVPVSIESFIESGAILADW